MVIGLTGPVASGKSLAARFLKTRGFTIIDADKAGHSILKRPPVRSRLKKIFGPGIFSGTNVNRKKLGDLVFHDSLQRKRLDSIMHPEITRTIRKKLVQLKGRDIVIDAALLFGLGLSRACDKTVLITAPKKTLLKRIRTRGHKGTPQRALAILRAQTGQKKYWKQCDIRIMNDGNPRELAMSLEKTLLSGSTPKG